MNCARSSEELHSLVDAELAPERVAEVERHAAGCPACRRRLSQLKQTAGLVGSLAAVEPPADLRARVARKAAQPAAPALTCATAREMLDDHAHGQLSRERAEAVDAHLIACKECGREMARLEQHAGLLGTLGAVEPPARIREKVRREVARRSLPVYSRPTFRGMIATAGVAVAAAAVVLALRVPAAVQGPAAVAERPTSIAERAAAATAAAAETPAPTTEAGTTGETRIATALEPASAERPEALAPRKPARALMTALARDIGRAAVTAAAEPASVASSRTMTSATTVAARPAGEPVTAGDKALPGAPIATPAPYPAVAYAAPAVEPEAMDDRTAQPRAARETVRAEAIPVAEAPLSEVRRALREQREAESPTLRPRHERDMFSSAGPIPAWGF